MEIVNKLQKGRTNQQLSCAYQFHNNSPQQPTSTAWQSWYSRHATVNGFFSGSSRWKTLRGCKRHERSASQAWISLGWADKEVWEGCGEVQGMHNTINQEGCQVTHCRGQSYRPGKQPDRCQSCQSQQLSAISTSRWMVLCLLGSFITRWFCQWKTIAAVLSWGPWSCLLIPAKVSLWAQPTWDAVGLCKILWVLSDWLSINYSQFKGY